MSDKIILRRGILAKFLPDNEAIRIFESLFSAVNDLISKIWHNDVVEVIIDTELTAVTQTLLIDCTAGDIDITLPPPADMVNLSGYSKKIGLTKIDATANVVNILPNDGETIVGEASQDLLLEGEVLNFLTDGTNWYLEC